MSALPLRNDELSNHPRLPNTNQGLVNNSSFRSPSAENRPAAGSRECPIPRARGDVNQTTLQADSESALWCCTRLDEWRRGLERRRGHPPPQGIRERDWHQFKLDAIDLLATQGPRLAALGWTTLELFGLHQTHAGARVSHSGLARFIHGGSLIEITEQLARIQRVTGSVLTYRRTEPQPGAVPAWELHKEINMAFETTMELDTGSGDSGPFLAWHAQASRDGAFSPGTFSIRDSAGRTAINLTEGICFDWANSSIGWMLTTGQQGVAPQKRWSPTRAKLEPCPGEGWKKAFRVQLAYVLNRKVAGRVVWEQASVAAFQGFVDIMMALKNTAATELPKLPVLVFTGHKAVTIGKGATLIPQFRLVRYVDRPACLPLDDAQQPLADDENDAWAGEAAPKGNGSMNMAGQTVVLPATTAPSEANTLVDDEIPF